MHHKVNLLDKCDPMTKEVAALRTLEQLIQVNSKQNIININD